MKLCAIMLNYFGSGDTIACCRSLLGQAIDLVCIVENSADPKELAALRQALAGHDRVEILETGRNLGFAGGVNFALRQLLPRGFEGFVILNTDTVLPPDLLEKLVQVAEKRSLDLAAPLIYRYPEQSELWSSGTYYNRLTGLLGDRLALATVFYLTGCCLLVRRRVFETAGLFDEAFFMYGEDVELCYRAARAGFSLGIVPDVRIYHKTGAASVHNSLFYEHQVCRGHLLLAKKLWPAAAAQAAALCIKLCVLLLRASARTLRFKNTTALRGYAAAVRELFSGRLR